MNIQTIQYRQRGGCGGEGITWVFFRHERGVRHIEEGWVCKMNLGKRKRNKENWIEEHKRYNNTSGMIGNVVDSCLAFGHNIPNLTSGSLL